MHGNSNIKVTIFTLLKALSVHFSGGDEENNGNVSHGTLCPSRVSNRQITITSEKRYCFGQIAA